MTERSYLYTDVAMQLRARIARGTYRPGTRLPSLADLTAEFDVSAITIRRALRELTYEGAIAGQQGRGVFVREKPKIHRVLAGDPSRSIGDEIARAGFTPRLQEIGFDTLEADDELAARMHVSRGTTIHRHRKLTFADDEAVAVHILHMRPKLARTLRRQLGNFFIFALLKDHDVSYKTLRCEFGIVQLAADQAPLFDLAQGHTMMRVDYTALDARGTPILLGCTICRADRFVFEVELPRRVGIARRR